MQIVEVNLIEGYPFYCPITGKQILFEDDFEPSPAMVYCYVQNESAFEYITGDGKVIFGKNLDDDNYLDYEKYDKILHTLMNDELTTNWVCFRLCSGGNGIGSFVVDHCIDMGYRASK